MFEEPKLPTPQPGLSEPELPEPVQSRTETASDKSLVEVESLDNEPVEPKGVENEPVEKLVLPDPLQDSESELDRGSLYVVSSTIYLSSLFKFTLYMCSVILLSQVKLELTQSQCQVSIVVILNIINAHGHNHSHACMCMFCPMQAS